MPKPTPKRPREQSNGSDASLLEASADPTQHVLLNRLDLDDIVSKAIISAMATISDEINQKMDSKFKGMSDRLDI